MLSEAAQEEKNSMVMKYACSEKELLDYRKAREQLEKKVADLSKERDILISRIQNLKQEKNSFAAKFERKVSIACCRAYGNFVLDFYSYGVIKTTNNMEKMLKLMM